jgi:hypothetical protein
MRYLVTILFTLSLLFALTLNTESQPLPTVLTATPEPYPPPQVILTADNPLIAIGDTVTVRVQMVNLGLPQFTISLPPNDPLLIPYHTQTPVAVPPSQSVFELLEGAMVNGAFEFRAITGGCVDVSIGVSGEAASDWRGSWYWTYATQSIRLCAVDLSPIRNLFQ